MEKINFQYGKFIKAKKFGIYDGIKGVNSTPFDFLKLEPPKSEALINNGVKHVIMSFDKNRKKSLHSGLIPIGEGCFIGNNINEKGKKDFIFIYYEVAVKTMHFFIVKNRNPRNKSNFGIELLQYFRSLDLIN